MKFFRFTFSISLLSFSLSAQLSSSYTVNAKLEIENKLIKINQKSIVLNEYDKSIDTLFFNDWSNSYSDSKTPLAQKMAEEFDRSFYISSKKSKGRTKIESFMVNKDLLEWHRLNNQNDIIYVVLKKPLMSSDTISLNISYSITIPDKQFTGVGYKKNFINIQDFIVALSPFDNGKWLIQSNLNLNDNSLFKSYYLVKWTYPKNLHLLSSMNKVYSLSKENFKIAHYESKLERSPKFIFSKENKIREFKTGNVTVQTDLFNESYDLAQFKIDKIHNFLSKNFDSKDNNESYLITSHDYGLRPLYGLNMFPKILNPFDLVFIEEIKFLKTYTTEYVRSQFNNLNFRENHWLSEGLTIFLIMKYIEVYYPDQKLIGKLSDMPFIKNYSIAKLGFNESFIIYSELMLRRNLHQAATTPKDLLIKFNERIATPYQVGVLFRYLEHYIGKDLFEAVLKEIYKVKNIEDLKLIVAKYSSDLEANNLIRYLDSIHTLDIRITDVIESNNEISVFTDQISNQKIPYEVALVKDNKIIDSKWISGKTKAKTTFFDKEADYVSVNPKFGLPETNKFNNWRSLNSKILNKPLSVRFFKDSEDPTKNQILINPTGFYNLYDGASFGARFHNKTLQSKPFNLMIEPSYSTIEKTLVGYVNIDYRNYNDSKSNYLTQFSFFGSSYHYASNSLYKIAVPSLKFYFRPNDLRSNLRHGLSLSWYSIQRESISFNNTAPNYSLGEIKYQFSNRGSVNYFTIENSFEIAKDFKKFILEMEYRKLFRSGRLFSSRLFFGNFIQNSLKTNNYFNFNLNRPNDYLFKYAYFGRSETEGFYSQQFILNEGGFKSIIPNSSSNQWIFSSNISMGIWKWFEGYIDVGILKNINQDHKSYYDYGFRLNFIPDYLELYFPVRSSHEYSLNKENYYSKIRFVLSLNPKDISAFFSRTWF